MSELSNEYEHVLDEAVSLQAEFEALEIPFNVDEKLLALWMERERESIERAKKKEIVSPKKCGISLNRLFAAYIGIGVMCLSIIVGLLQGQESATILQTTCIVFLVYTLLGAFVGLVAEHCVNDSVETLLRDIVGRNRNVPSSVASSEAHGETIQETMTQETVMPATMPAV